MNLERSGGGLDAAAGTLLPRGPFQMLHGGAEIDLRAGRGPLVLLIMHLAECEPCRGHLDALLEHQVEWSHWGARVFGVAPAENPHLSPQEKSAASGTAMLIDRDHVLADGRAGVIVADEWGEVHFAQSAGTGHAMPMAEELIEWARFVSIQCPECEGPEGKWRSV